MRKNTPPATSQIPGYFAMVLLASCAPSAVTLERAAPSLQGQTLADSERLLKLAKKFAQDEEAATVCRLRAAEIAWQVLDTDGGDVRSMTYLSEEQRHAVRILTTATEKVSVNFIGENYKPVKTFTWSGYSYKVRAGLDQKPGIFPLASLESAVPAREVKHTLCRNWHTEDGVGAPSAPKWKRPDDPRMQRFVTTRGYLEPITAVLAFDRAGKRGGSREASITGYDPTYVSRVKLGETEYPLAADFTAPIVQQTYDINEITVALSGLIHPGVLDSRLILLEPYDPERIPILLVHGLNSHPRMWKDVINDLRADPKLRGKYQFMLFYYPTGWPIAYSAMRLREELAAFDALTGRHKKMVVVGHSMGGLLSRTQVISPGRKLWDGRLGEDADKYYRKLPANHDLKKSFLFHANPNIGREIFICVPHRGSGLADLSLTTLFIRFLQLPTKITSSVIDLPSNLFQHGQLTSIGGLSPHNQLFKDMEGIPIQVPFHSIIGDRGRGDTPDSSDGVVPYWSSHLAGARSELIVPDDHGAFDHPMAIEEMRRILLLNLADKEPASTNKTATPGR